MRKRGTVCGRSVGIYAGDRASGGCPPLSRKAHPRGVCDEAGAQVPPYLTPLRETFNAVRRVARAGRPGDPRLRGFAPWVTVRHRGISPSCYLDQKRLSALRFPVCGGGHKERERFTVEPSLRRGRRAPWRGSRWSGTDVCLPEETLPR